MELLKNHTNNYLEAGCDEVGRGCLCGPVVAAAVILNKNFKQNSVNDSKLLTFKKRLELDDYIKNNSLDFAIAEISSTIIDEENILNASISAMHKALNNLKQKPEFIIVDGNKFRSYQNIPHECIIKGDQKYLSIAAASILAKNYRDQLMINLHEEFPQYGWNKNMGYATKFHREALIKFGPTIHHRKSFRLIFD
ncbi:ribonuclease HII [Halpernia sp.]|uniref:ribonuclease HII n=1 Tax=Halpernia sp. TaxID=2782209 RepID=UPI003A8EBEB5